MHNAHAHCEIGVTTNLLRQKNIILSEPIIFGIGSGLFFAHLPFVKVGGVPGTTYRAYPGIIFKDVCKRLNITFSSVKFRQPSHAIKALNQNISYGIPTGLQVSECYLPFLPEVFRFHFNAHNLIVYALQDNLYHVSDPVMEQTQLITEVDLTKARFAKGYPKSRGRMYWIGESSPRNDETLLKAIKKVIQQTCFMMMSPPLAWFGLKAIKLLSRKIRKYPTTLTSRQATIFVGNIIRLQEETGTGSACYRFLYAAFLQEAGQRFNHPAWIPLAKEMTIIGDMWRNYAYEAARLIKNRGSNVSDFDRVSD
jgi:hypothetical protein